MNYYKIDDNNALAIIDKEPMENANAFMLKCKYIIHNPKYAVELSFKGDHFFMLQIGVFLKLEEITENEFKDIVKKETPKVFKDLKKEYGDKPFALETRERFLRDAYSYYFLNEGPDDFHKFWEGL